MELRTLSSADPSPWDGPVSAKDGLPLRDSGSWIEEKHRALVYVAEMFATGMKPTANKRGWPHRVYLELFAGPGLCHVRETSLETAGSPLKVINHEFTRFIFVDIATPAAQALAKRLAGFPNADKVEIWNATVPRSLTISLFRPVH